MEEVLSVSAYIRFLNSLINPHRVVLRGEVGDKINHYEGYSFFYVKDIEDGTSMINCFVGKNVLNQLYVPMEAGMELEITGYSNIRADRGNLTFQVQRMELLGEGALKKQFELLRKKLEEQGYFENKFKSPIPTYIKKIALVTSSGGRGAKKDFLTNLGNYGFEIDFFDTRVEGAKAVDEVCSAINQINKSVIGYDVIVLIRGGGSWESLRAFNTEEVAEAIFASKIPVIVGVGHEDDLTIACLVADKRVSTPTHAATLITTPWREAKTSLINFNSNIRSCMLKCLRETKDKLERSFINLNSAIADIFKNKRQNLQSFFLNINSDFGDQIKKIQQVMNGFDGNSHLLRVTFKRHQDKLAESSQLLSISMNAWKKSIHESVINESKRLTASDPNLKLKQGYSLTMCVENGTIMRNTLTVPVGTKILTRLSEGQLISVVSEKN